MQISSFGIVHAILALHIFVFPASTLAKSINHVRQPVDEDPTAEADRIANSIAQDSENAQAAAEVARKAAVVANKVANHSIHVTQTAKSALKDAMGALHEARVESHGQLNRGQQDSLKMAEAKLREATKKAEYGELKKVKDSHDVKREQMQTNLDKKKKTNTELEQMRTDVRTLRQKLKEKGGDAETEKDLKELEGDLGELEKDGKGDAATDDELKAEIERLRNHIEKMEAAEASKEATKNDKELMTDVGMKPLHTGKGGKGTRALSNQEVTPVQEKGIDIDTAMPYGDLEPFGREDTAQELTESSVKESDEMVDQLERAEVAEEKRSVFRALTRLRGAAITSFDGVARSQTGNIDEYNKVHKWRKTHPLHHLADEESDVSKWAFPDNADLVQLRKEANLVQLKAKAMLQK